jgi:hypothetical protein
MNGQEMVRRMLVLRQTFQINNRLNLEFQALLSKLLREHGVSVEDDLLRNLMLAVPDELMGGSRIDPGEAYRPQSQGTQTPSLGPQVPDGGIGPQPPDGGIGPQPPDGGIGPQPPGGGIGPQPPGGGIGPQPPGGGIGPQPPERSS